MARYIQRPENALKRANEFIDVGKPARALDTLQEVFRNKKWTYTWSEAVIEPIMFKYLDLCVELKKSHIAKEGLFQYRNMFQLVNVGSLENVIRGYLKMAEKRTEEAQKQSSEAVLDIDDLDNLTTPESILMSAVSGDDAQDRSDRTILLPWVKFLWESYCQCLELLRINSHCETLYHDIARMAFHFCLKYNCKMEFRKLCEKLRKHLDDICKPTTQTANVSITRPETQQLNLDTRLYQLDSAIQMELWQEAYKAIEDIHGLMGLSKKAPLPKTMANYYQKLAMVFWKAGNKLFHAAALLKFFQLSREMKKNITTDELQRLASHVLIAVLAIPLPSAHPEFDRFIETDKSPYEKAQKLAVLLGLQQPPTRQSLLKDVHRLNLLELADPLFQNLYKWLEVEFDPLNLCKHIQTCVDQMNTEENTHLAQYAPAIHHVTLVRLVFQISQVYQSIEFSRILALAKFTNAFILERILVDCVRHNDMQITIDHKNRCIYFGTDLTESQRQDSQDGPSLQSMPSEQIRSQLVNMSVVLHRSIAAINPNHKKADTDALRAQLVKYYHDNKVKAHQQVLLRQKMIEERKEYIEQMNVQREEEEIRRQEEAARQQKLAEQKRIEQEQEERTRKKLENEKQYVRERNLKEKVEQMATSALGKKVLDAVGKQNVDKIDAEQLAVIEQDQLAKERKELQSKLKSQEKKVDYFERAKRQEEIPLLEKYLAEKQKQDKAFWEEQERARIETAITEHEHNIETVHRLSRMTDETESYFALLKVERKSIQAEKLRDFERMLEVEKQKRLQQRVNMRRQERKAEWQRAKEEEKARIELELRMAKEEEERLESERRAKERAADMEKIRIMTEKQRAREEEAERKFEAESLKLLEAEREKAPPARGDGHWRRPTAAAAADEGDWRTATRGPPKNDERSEQQQQTSAKPEAWRPKFQDTATAAEPASPEASSWRRVGDRDRRDDRRDRDERRGGDRDERRGGDRDERRGGDRDERRGGDRDERRGGDRDERRGGDRDERRGGDRDRRDDRRGGDRDDRRGGAPRNDGWRKPAAAAPAGDDNDWRARGSQAAPADDGNWRTRGKDGGDEQRPAGAWRTAGPRDGQDRRRDDRRGDDRRGDERRGGDDRRGDDRRGDDRRGEDRRDDRDRRDKAAPREDNEWRGVKRR